MRSRGNRFGGALSLDLGIDLSLDPPEATGPAPVTPYFIVAHAVATNYEGILYVTFYNCETGGDACSVQWKLVSGKKTIAFDPSTPDQNSPHSAARSDIDGYVYGGFSYDLQWRYSVGGAAFSAYATAVSSFIYLPAYGEPPSSV